jgi:ATP-binding cassette, subfamily B, multidrug efflux pump
VWSWLARYRGRVLLGGVCLAGTTALATAIPWLLQHAIDALARPAGAAAAARYGAWMAAFAVLQGGIRIASRLFLFDAARSAEYDLRSALFRKFLTLSPTFYRSLATGEVMARMTNDVPALRSLWGPGILNLINTVLLVGLAVVLLLRIDVSLTIWALLPYPAVFVVARVFAGRLFKLAREVQDQAGVMSSSLQEDLTGMQVVKTYTLEEARGRRFETLARAYLAKNMSLVAARGLMLPLFGALGSVGVVIALFIGGRKVALGEMSLGELVAFQAYLILLAWPTLALGWILTLFQRGYAAWSRIARVLDEEPTIRDGDGPPLAPEDARGDVEIRRLTVRHGEREVLSDVSLKIPAGRRVAIVGTVGGGKSTLVDAIPRLVEIPAGTVFIDGRDVTSLPLVSLRRLIGYAPQEAVLFSTTIRENIAFGGSGDPAVCAQRAGLARDLAAFPRGLETIVGERGITLSGGQRQRVALARALAADPRILLLDDSLSSVDAQTEREILAGLDEASRGRTTILISHRLSAVSACDRIFVLDDGRLVDEGTHDDLVSRPGPYASLYREQLADHAIAEAS